MKIQDQQNKEFEEFYYSDEPDLTMPGDFFEQKLKDEIVPAEERFKMPTDKQIVEIALLFNDGKLQRTKLRDMIAMTEFILERLYENGDVTIKSSKEYADQFKKK